MTATNEKRIADALVHIDPDDREQWLRMGMAIRSEMGDAGFDVWNDWSQQSPAYRLSDAKATWKSINGTGGVTLGSLFYEAKANGWSTTHKYTPPTRQQLEKQQKQREHREQQEKAEIDKERAQTKAHTKALLETAKAAPNDHPYLLRKGVETTATLKEIDQTAAEKILGYSPQAAGEPLTGKLLVVPIKQGDDIATVELIDESGRKAGLYGRGTRTGGYWATRRLPDGEGRDICILIGEGMATVLSASTAVGSTGVAALSAHNVVNVAHIMRQQYPYADLVVLADLQKSDGSPDPRAVKAAIKNNARLAVPQFGDVRAPDQTDFNDMMQCASLNDVAQTIHAALVPDANDGTAPAGDSEVNGWPDPHPLTAKIEPEPYPLDALPLPIREAVEEVAGFVKAPVPMVASSALAALSLAIQAHADAKRLEKLHGPVGLFILVIADSGERKSTCDGFFTKTISDYEETQAEAAKPALKDHRAAIEAWESKRGGVKEKIRQLAKEQKSTAGMESALRDLEHDKPEPPRIPRLLYADATPEALAYGLAKQWPSGGVVSAEAGIVFGSHGMGKDSVMRNLGLLNQLWDGKSLTIDRRSTESFTVRGARLTVALQVQEPTLREFFTRSGALARGNGFLARFLVAWPESTQGMRQIDPDAPDGPATWPHLAAFHSRIAAILDQPAPINEAGALTPLMLPLTPEAKAAWVDYHNAIESELSSGGELYDVRDVASKSADNAARLAALFQIFEGAGGAIGLAAFEGASLITAWHLNESRRFFGELALPAELADAARLDGWLIEHCRRNRTHLVSNREAQQFGPIRNKEKLAAALRELEDLDRVKVTQEGRRKIVMVNPALIGVVP